MLFKLIGFLFKLCLKAIIAIIVIILGIILIANNTNNIPLDDTYRENMTGIIRDYNINEAAALGQWCSCPLCETYFYKSNIPTCSDECEAEYHRLKHAWDSGDRNYIESHGRNFK